MQGPLLAVIAACLVLTAAACSKHDASSGATDAPAAATTDAAAPPQASGASPLPAAGATDAMPASADPASAATSPDPSASGSTAGTSEVDAPIYPGATLAQNQLIDTTANGVHVVVASLTTPDDFATVDAWYKSRLSSYTPMSLQMSDAQMSSYTQGSDSTPPFHSITITRKRDLETKVATQIVISIKVKAP